MTGTAIKIRPATAADEPAIDRFAHDVIHNTYDRLTTVEYANELLQQWWGPALHESVINGFVHIAVVDGDVIGLAHVGEWNAEPALWKLYVTSGRRGDGLGRRFIDAVIATLPTNTPRLLTEHIAANVGAERFYVREGFARTGIDEDTYDPRTWTVWRAKVLDPPAAEHGSR